MKFKKEKYLEELSSLVANNGFTNNDKGLLNSLNFFKDKLLELGFSIRLLGGSATKTPVLYAVRKSNVKSGCIGLYGHYDVEPTDDLKWKSPPTELTLRDDRLFGRGVGDNLGILLLRIHAIEALVNCGLPEIHWLIEGEEEKGSFVAHKEFPLLEIPNIDLWLEETGFFDLGTSRQRFLTLNEDSKLVKAKEAVLPALSEYDFTTYTENRSLTKFDACPFLTHILKDQPYLAIGPNDEYSKIHEPNESLSMPLIEKSYEQFISLLKFYSE